MAGKPNGVTWFAVYAADPQKMRLFFPEGRVSCSNCRHLYADGLNRARCRISGEIVYEPNYPGLPEICPFEPTGEAIGHKYMEGKA